MNQADLDYLQKWVGKTRFYQDVLHPGQARLMAATLGEEASVLRNGAELPLLWHWLYFLSAEPPSALGPDGHPARGDFLPPVPLPNRMWAGGQLEFHRPLRLGEAAEKRSTIVSVDGKQGRSGALVFVRVLHEIVQHQHVCVSEYHDIVYKEAGKSSPSTTVSPAALSDALTDTSPSRRIMPDSTMLFRYSALTFNGHRIHYDADYCRTVEGYPNLVIHGPLNATLLAGFAADLAQRPLRHFNYRGLQPAILGVELELRASFEANRLQLQLVLPDGAISMRAEAIF